MSCPVPSTIRVQRMCRRRLSYRGYWRWMGIALDDMRMRWTTCFHALLFVLFRWDFVLAFHRVAKFVHSVAPFLPIFSVFRIPFLSCILPLPFFIFRGRLSSLSRGVRPFSCGACCWACGQFFGPGGIEESRDSFRDAWFSVVFRPSPFTDRRLFGGQARSPTFVWVRITGAPS